MPSFTELVEVLATVIDGIGVAAIVIGICVATIRCAVNWQREPESIQAFRRDIGRGILLGLDFLVAADIIRTVAVTPTLQGVLVLGLIVLIRTFLSIALQVELEGKWPWQTKGDPTESGRRRN